MGECPSSGHCLGILAGLNGSEMKEAVDKLGSQLTTAGIKVAAVTTVSMGKESRQQKGCLTMFKSIGTNASAVRGGICSRLDC